MLDIKTLDELTEKFMSAMPEGLKLMKNDLKKQVRQGLLSAFSKMELVTREEFDVQSAVLARTRQKLETLEQQLAELEQKLAQKSNVSSSQSN